jgi:hypothetical protein
MRWFRRKIDTGDAPPAESPVVGLTPQPSLWHWRMAIRLFRRAGKTTTVNEAPTVVRKLTSEHPDVPALPLRRTARSVWQGFLFILSIVFNALDRALIVIAVPFGVHIREPRRRYAVLLGVFACLFVIGALPVPYLPLLALAAAYLGVLAIGRAWVANEHQRTAIVKKLQDGDPDELPDLRGAALASALQLLILFPLAFRQLHRQFGLFVADPSANLLDWEWFSLDKTYLKALPDWSMLYGIHVSSIDFNESWDRHLVLLSRLTFDYVLLQGLFRLLAIRATIREAVAVVQTDPDVAVRVGRRAIPALVKRLGDPDRAVRGAAANAITQINDPEGMNLMHEALGGEGQGPE